ncbi:MAG: DUF4870 domain-containing protein [Candidatus Altiarchaeales archaeon]|nr:DUF4870 domain-containing protein [Candidatus Altiarchaeales archaeon]
MDEEEPDAETSVKTKAGSDDNLMAAISHIGILLGGALIALFIWLTQRDKSYYVRIQAKQALMFQVSIILLNILLLITIIGFIFLPFLWLVSVVYILYAAYKAYNGEDFRYVVIKDKLDKDDNNLMSAVSHLGIISGPVSIPLVVWLLQKDKSEYVNFQAKQALMYQLLIWGASILIMILSYIFIIVTFGIGVIVVYPVYIVLLLVWVILALYAFYAAYKCYQGDEFRYVVIGDMFAG